MGVIVKITPDLAKRKISLKSNVTSHMKYLIVRLCRAWPSGSGRGWATLSGKFYFEKGFYNGNS